MFVACIQMEPVIGNKRTNVSRSVGFLEAAAERGAELVVLPELVNSGYVFRDRAEALELAEPVPDGETTATWLEAAARLELFVVAGIAERDGGVLYNSAVIIGPNGYVGRFRKVHLWGDEKRVFSVGNLGFPVFEAPFGRLSVAICYDGWFPETYRAAALQGADILCVPTNWVPMPGQPKDRPAMANTLTMAGAHSNDIFIACADRTGVERGQPFEGQSLIVNRHGWPIAGPASRDREEILVAEIELRRSSRRSVGADNDVLQDRRPEVYAGIANAPFSVAEANNSKNHRRFS
jgi:N-carbamoylputrescine amidase